MFQGGGSVIPPGHSTHLGCSWSSFGRCRGEMSSRHYLYWIVFTFIFWLILQKRKTSKFYCYWYNENGKNVQVENNFEKALRCQIMNRLGQGRGRQISLVRHGLISIVRKGTSETAAETCQIDDVTLQRSVWRLWLVFNLVTMFSANGF